MRLAITGGESKLARALAAAWRSVHEVELVGGDLRDPAMVAPALEGKEAVVALAPRWRGLPEGVSEAERLDHAARGTYVVLTEAARAGVGRIVLGSTLDL